jgi:transposase
MENSAVCERVDDIPVIVSTLQGMNLPQIINENCKAHGNWAGLSIGETTTIWLAHIMSTTNHRLVHVQEWAELHLSMLSSIFGKPVRIHDFTDDRLAIILEKFHDSAVWDAIEQGLNQEIIRAYELKPTTVRIDCTTVSSRALVDDNGLVQFGKSKEHPDLPAIKIPLATLDPFGLPIHISTIGGNRADDPQYLPVIRSVRESLKKIGLLYVGDKKMCATATRADLASHGDYYLCPISETLYPVKRLSEIVRNNQNSDTTLIPVSRKYANGEEKIIAHGFEVSDDVTGVCEGKELTWTERRVIINSVSYAASQRESVEAKIQKATNEIEHLMDRGRGKKPPKTLDDAKGKVVEILENGQLTDLLTVVYDVKETREKTRGYRNNPARTEIKQTIKCHAKLNPEVYAEICMLHGWRVYVTNRSQEDLPLEQVVLVYRNQYVIEDAFHRLKGKPLSLYPMDLNRDDHIDGLVKLLSIALRGLICIEIKVYDSLKKKKEKFIGIYAYYSNHKTDKPRAERLLEIFHDITLTLNIIDGKKHVLLTTLTDKQRKVLSLLDLKESIYSKLTDIL